VPRVACHHGWICHQRVVVTLQKQLRISDGTVTPRH
jgi:hypothetical protein